MKRLGTALVLACGLAIWAGSAVRSEAYREGQRAIERQDWDEASRLYATLAAKKTDEADAALYWKAYADWKRERERDALDGVAKLLSAYPKSAWVDDAKALQLEIREETEEVRTESLEDEDLKLYALDGLLQVEPEKAVPVLEKLLTGNSSTRIKARALFVLSQSDSPRAGDILVRTARSGQPLSVRVEAVRSLGIAEHPQGLAALAEIARDSSAPPEVRYAVVEAYLMADRPDLLLSIARSDADPRLREKAIQTLGAAEGVEELRQLWSTEKDPDLRETILNALGIAGDVTSLAKAARDADPGIRRKALQGLGVAEGAEARRALRQLYGEFSSADDKREVAQALMVQEDAKTLIELFRAEKDPAMKKVLIQQLSLVDDPEASRMIFEILGEKP